MHKKGFTLLELIVVIIIIGILATIALPQFGRTKERALGNEAKANLKLIAAAEKIYKMESSGNSYVFCNCNCSGTAAQCCENATAGCNYLLKLSLTTQNWIYMAVPVGSGPTGTFVAYADRQGSGGYLNCQYSINQSQDEPVPNASCP